MRILPSTLNFKKGEDNKKNEKKKKRKLERKKKIKEPKENSDWTEEDWENWNWGWNYGSVDSEGESE